jgi:hypothetical protein
MPLPRDRYAHRSIPDRKFHRRTCLSWLATLAPLSLALFAYERTLVPLYGAGLTRYALNKFVFTAVALAGLEFAHFSACLPLITLLSIAPSTSYWTAVHTARLGDPLWGLVVTHSVVIFPIVYGFARIAMDFEVGVFSFNEMRCMHGLPSFPSCVVGQCLIRRTGRSPFRSVW